jgi:hypothetical protein
MTPDSYEEREADEEAWGRLCGVLAAAGLRAAVVLYASAVPLATLACLAAAEALAPVPAASVGPAGLRLAIDGPGVPVTRLLAGAVVVRLVERLSRLNADAGGDGA